MTDRDFDAYAEEAIERKREWTATWEKFCERNGFERSSHYGGGRNNKKSWSKRTFRYALERMPKDHPDRWKYKIGAWFAPIDNANGKDWVGESILLFAIICLDVFAFVAGIQAYILGYWILGTFCMLCIVIPWLVFLVQRYRAFLL